MSDSKEQILENPPQEIKIQTETGNDRISKLPDTIVVQILSLLPLKDAYKTSILSKHWKYLWTFIDNVVFECSQVNNFIYFTDNVLCHLDCSTIKKFSLSFDFGSSNVVECNSKIGKWVEVAVVKNVEDLYLAACFGSHYYSLPQVLCNSSSILNLNCTNCIISEQCVLNWTSLKRLTLQRLSIRDEHIEQISSSCPQLECLKLVKFCGLHRLRMTNPKCRRLQLIDHWHPKRDNWSLVRDCGYLEIVAPHVLHLEISGLFDGLEFRLGDLSSLVSADLTFTSHDCLHRLDEIDKTLVISNLLASLCCAYDLTIPSWLIEVISMLMFEEEDTSLPLLKCKRLTINSWITRFSFVGIASLLRSTPQLENMRILPESEPRGIQLINSFARYWNEGDIDLSTKKSCSLQQNLFEGSLQYLKNVKVISEFCRPISREGSRDLPQFLKYLLEHAIVLEKLVITPEHRECISCSNNVSKLITKLACPRASSSPIFLLGSASDIDFLEE